MSDELCCVYGPEDISPNKDGGIMKSIINVGEGVDSPKHGDHVTIHYTTKLVDEKYLDSSLEGVAFQFTIGKGKAILAWDIGVKTMKKGEICKLVCQPDFTYRQQEGLHDIPENTSLIFYIQLIEWTNEDLFSDNVSGVISPSDRENIEDIIGVASSSKQKRSLETKTYKEKSAVEEACIATVSFYQEQLHNYKICFSKLYDFLTSETSFLNSEIQLTDLSQNPKTDPLPGPQLNDVYSQIMVFEVSFPSICQWIKNNFICKQDANLMEFFKTVIEKNCLTTKPLYLEMARIKLHSFLSGKEQSKHYLSFNMSRTPSPVSSVYESSCKNSSFSNESAHDSSESIDILSKDIVPIKFSEPKIQLSESFNLLQGFAKQLFNKDDAMDFRFPVNPKYTEYYRVIKNPVDLHTVLKKIKDGLYNSEEECIQDIFRIFTNCMRFNEKSSVIVRKAKRLMDHFVEMVATMNNF